MQSPVISSTFFLTLLMMIGLVFFIRASTKERIEVIQFAIAQPLDSALEQLQAYFLDRSYQEIEGESTTSSSTPQASAVVKQSFEGMVRPSVFLAVLLLLLAGIGFLCLALVLSILLPQLGAVVWGLVLLAPAASFFYWKKSSRIEQVSFKVEPFDVNADTASSSQSAIAGSEIKVTETKVTVMGHRDELASLQQSLTQKSLTIRVLEPELG